MKCTQTKCILFAVRLMSITIWVMLYFMKANENFCIDPLIWTKYQVFVSIPTRTDVKPPS